MVPLKTRPIAMRQTIALRRDSSPGICQGRLRIAGPRGDGLDDRLEERQDIFESSPILRWATPSRAFRVANGEIELVLRWRRGREEIVRFRPRLPWRRASRDQCVEHDDRRSLASGPSARHSESAAAAFVRQPRQLRIDMRSARSTSPPNRCGRACSNDIDFGVVKKSAVFLAIW